jgi:hypothetical protein
MRLDASRCVGHRAQWKRQCSRPSGGERFCQRLGMHILFSTSPPSAGRARPPARVGREHCGTHFFCALTPPSPMPSSRQGPSQHGGAPRLPMPLPCCLGHLLRPRHEQTNEGWQASPLPARPWRSPAPHPCAARRAAEPLRHATPQGRRYPSSALRVAGTAAWRPRGFMNHCASAWPPCLRQQPTAPPASLPARRQARSGPHSRPRCLLLFLHPLPSIRLQPPPLHFARVGHVAPGRAHPCCCLAFATC